MNTDKFSAIAHRDHDYCNPVAAAKIERILDLMPLDAHSRVLDLGCGRAELALRIVERFGSTIVAVERSPFMLDAAREAHADWSRLPWEERASVYLRAAELRPAVHETAEPDVCERAHDIREHLDRAPG